MTDAIRLGDLVASTPALSGRTLEIRRRTGVSGGTITSYVSLPPYAGLPECWRHCASFTADQARRLAAALVEAADALDPPRRPGQPPASFTASTRPTDAREGGR